VIRPAAVAGAEVSDLQLHSRTVDPTAYPLSGFSCGRRGKRSEIEVNTIVAEYHRGTRFETEVRVTELMGDLVGLAAYSTSAAAQPPNTDGYAYIALIGLSEAFRGRSIDGRRLGDFVLEDILQRIEARWSRSIRWIVTQVDPKNPPGRNLFERHGFLKVADATDVESNAVYRKRAAV
jgi:ribosomal protein S18 acetylase RimI-like enzyme